MASNVGTERVHEALEDLVVPHQVLRSTATNYIANAVVLGVGFLLTPYILHEVGPVNFGLWILIESVAGYATLLDLGISAAVVKYVADTRARHDFEEAGTLVSTALALYAALGTVALAATVVLAAVIPSAFDLPSDQRAVATSLTLLAGGRVAAAIPGATPMAILRGLHRFDLINMLLIAGTLASAVATIVVLSAGGGIVGVVAVGLVTTVVMQLSAAWLVRRTFPELRLDLHRVARARVRRVLGYSTSVSIIQIGGRLRAKSDALVIGAMMPVRAITPFALALRLSDLVTLLADQFVKVVLPLASEAYAKGGVETVRALFLTATRITLAICVPAVAVLAALASSILSVWVGEEYSAYGYLVVILAVATAVNVLVWPLALVAQAMERHRPLAWFAVASGVANVSLSFALIVPLGLLGVALGTLIPTVLESAAVLLWPAKRILGVAPGTFARAVFVPLAVPTGVIVGVLLILRWAIPTSLASLFGIVVVAALAYVPAYLLFAASPAERATYRRAMTGALRFRPTRG